jgi:hypothetical protein
MLYESRRRRVAAGSRTGHWALGAGCVWQELLDALRIETRRTRRAVTDSGGGGKSCSMLYESRLMLLLVPTLDDLDDD